MVMTTNNDDEKWWYELSVSMFFSSVINEWWWLTWLVMTIIMIMKINGISITLTVGFSSFEQSELCAGFSSSAGVESVSSSPAGGAVGSSCTTSSSKSEAWGAALVSTATLLFHRTGKEDISQFLNSYNNNNKLMLLI